jgi:hypothetical protein
MVNDVFSTPCFFFEYFSSLRHLHTVYSNCVVRNFFDTINRILFLLRL